MVLRNVLLKATVLFSVLFALGSFAPALAATYSVTVQTNASTYSGSAQIMISGTVSPPPGTQTAVVITVLNPSNSTVDIGEYTVNPTTGAYNGTTVAGGPMTCGGSPCWVAGTYTVNATWGGPSGTATAITTFTYSPNTTSTSTSSSSSSSSSSSTSSSTTSSTSSSTTTSSTTSSTASTSSTSSTTLSVNSRASSASTSSTKASGGSSTGLYLGIAAVVVVVVVLGVFMWRRSVARSYGAAATR